LLTHKDPSRVEAGRRGAERRWDGHDTKVVRLDVLTKPQRELVLALVRAAKSQSEKAKAPVPAQVETSAQVGDDAA